MLLPRISALLLAAHAVHALQNAHPFLLLSSGPLQASPFQSYQIATADDVESRTTQYLSACDRKHYIVFDQAGLKAADFQHMPRLQARVRALGEGAYVQVPEVIGGVNTWAIAERTMVKCLALDPKTNSFWEELDVLAAVEGDDREEIARRADETIDRELAILDESGEPWVMVYAGSELQDRVDAEDHQDLPYEMDEPYPSPLHTDLKRDTEMHKRQMRARQANGTENPQSNLPLFEKYQFLSPPLFMGLTVSLILFLILYVGVTAIAGLEVSYAAFSKEMGPQAQNKGKQ